MGILDDLKPQQKRPVATELALDGPALALTWSDGHKSKLQLKFLRERCPCAGCMDEWTGKRTLDPATIPANIRPLKMEPVGRYAIRIEWSDGHASGIYSWDTLLRLEQEATQ